MEVVLIENTAAAEIRPISGVTVERFCKDFNDTVQGWILSPHNRGPRGRTRDRVTPRSVPPAMGDRGFGVTEMVCEALEMMPLTVGAGTGAGEDGEDIEEHKRQVRLARMGILPATVKGVLRSLGFKKLGPLVTRIRGEILWAQYRRIQHKRRTRETRIFDDMG